MQKKSPRAHSKRDVRARIGGYTVVRFSGDLGIGEYAKKSARDYPRWHVSRDGYFCELPSLRDKEGEGIQIELCMARVTACRGTRGLDARRFRHGKEL